MTLLSGGQKGFHPREAGAILHSFPFCPQAGEERAVTAVPVVLGGGGCGQAVEQGGGETLRRGVSGGEEVEADGGNGCDRMALGPSDQAAWISHCWRWRRLSP